MTKQTTTLNALLKIIGLFYVHYEPPYLENFNKAIRDSCPKWESMKPDYSDEFTGGSRITVNEKDDDVFLCGNGGFWLIYICPSDYKQSFYINFDPIISYLEESISLADLMLYVERWDIGEGMYFHNTYISYQFANADSLYYMNGLFTNNMLGHQFMNWNGNPLEVKK